MPKSNTTIRIASWQHDREALTAIRSQVFIKEQNVPEELEWDEFDESATHFLALLNNQAIACARLKPDGQIGRMAVLRKHRKNGIGKKLLQSVLQEAKTKNLKKLYLHAQLSAIDFYKKAGFNTIGDVFYEAEIAHRQMLIKLQ